LGFSAIFSFAHFFHFLSLLNTFSFPFLCSILDIIVDHRAQAGYSGEGNEKFKFGKKPFIIHHKAQAPRFLEQKR